MLEFLYYESGRMLSILLLVALIYGTYALPRDLYGLIQRWRARRWRARERARQRAE